MYRNLHSVVEINAMVIVVQIFVALVLVGFAYWWISLKKYNKKYAWIPKAKGHPIFGNVLDFRNSTETLKTISKCLEGCDGICFINLMVKNILVITNIEVLEFILASPTLINKSLEYRYLGRWLGNGILTGTGQRWKKSRKIITPAFHFSILNQFIPVYESNADIMIKLLEKELDKESVDVCPYITMCTLDIICETSMGVSINAQTNRYSDYVQAVKEMCRIIHDRSFSAIKQFNLLYVLTKDFYKELNYVKTLHSYTKSVIQHRRKELNNIKNVEGNMYEDLGVKKKVAFLDLLLQSKSDGEPLPDWYIREEVDTLMFEGHDTTTSALSFALYCLAENSEVQTQAVEEQKNIFGNDIHRPVSFQDVQEMKYLELVIKETLRLYPSVPFYTRYSEVDVEYKDGKMLPKNTTILINPYELHRNPKIFPDPEKFNPKRFETLDKISSFMFLPFSAGPRNCIGQKFAMQEMKTILSKVLRNYELLPASPKHKLILAAETVLKSANGIKIQIRKRNWD